MHMNKNTTQNHNRHTNSPYRNAATCDKCREAVERMEREQERKA